MGIGEQFELEKTGRITPEPTAWRCKWEWNDREPYWETECGNAFTLTASSPSEWSMKYCPYCGKPISEDAV